MITRDEAYTIYRSIKRVTEEFCNYTLTHKIHRSAIEGFSNITVEIPFSIDLEYALEIIRKNGFDVSTDNAVIYIKWGEDKEDEI